MTLKSDAKSKGKLTFGFKYDMRNLVNLHPTTQKSENSTSMGSLSKVYKFWAKKSTEELSFMLVNSDAKFEYTLTLWFQMWHEELGKLSLEQRRKIVKVMYFLDKSSPSNLNFLDFPLVVWSCLNSSCDFGNQESVFVWTLHYFVIS